VNSVTVIETLGNDGGKSSFQFFNLGSKLVEIIIELFVLDIHDIVIQSLKLVHSLFELDENLL